MNLFPFQQTAVDKFGLQKAVLCGDEMGTGKSYIGTARDLKIREKYSGKTLVVAPMSLLQMWEKMFKAEGLSVRVIDPKNRDLLFRLEDQCEVHGVARPHAIQNYRATQKGFVETATSGNSGKTIPSTQRGKQQMPKSGLQTMQHGKGKGVGDPISNSNLGSTTKSSTDSLQSKTGNAKSVSENSLWDETTLDRQSIIATKQTRLGESSALDATSVLARQKSLEPTGSIKPNCTCPDVYVVHWPALQQRGGHWLTPALMDKQFLHIICDEVHHAQNRQAQQTIGLKRLKTVFKTGLSGTPITNTPDKLWSILNWLYPDEWSSYWRFYGRYVDFEIDPAGGYRKIKGPKNVPILHEKINPYYIRRLKEEVLPELPNKYYTEIRVDLTYKQQRAYDDMRKNMITWLDDAPLVAPVVVAQLQRLQQFADAYAKLTPQGLVELTEPSSKLDALMELIESQSQVVVFSQFRQMIDLLERRLKKKDIEYSKITGKVPQFMRQREVDRFQSGKAQVFMGTIAAGGEGITLTRASCVAFLDRSWSPADNSQAEDRLHRIGQENAVQVVDFIARGTIDLGRRTRLEMKKEWLRQLLDP